MPANHKLQQTSKEQKTDIIQLLPRPRHEEEGAEKEVVATKEEEDAGGVYYDDDHDSQLEDGDVHPH